MKRWLGIRKWRVRQWLGLTLGLAVLIIAPVRAAALSQGYRASDTLSVGSMVGLDPNATNTVRAANTDRASELFGVVVDAGSSLLSVSSAGTNVQVVTTGTATVLVSNANGDIKKGDGITVSPISGVGMKATLPGRIIGLAQADFSSSTAGATTEIVDSKSGKQQVAVGGIAVAVSVSYFTPKTSAGSVIPQSVQNVASLLAGKPVSTFRIVSALSLLLLGLALVVVILNGAVRSSMESIGRNPLAKSAVGSGLLKVLLLTLAILLTTFGSVYFVIKG